MFANTIASSSSLNLLPTAPSVPVDTSGQAFALTGERGGIIARIEPLLFSGLFAGFVLAAASFAASLR